MRALVIIPAYNEEMNIENTVSQIKSKCPLIDYIVINDGSTDKTAEICRKNNFPLLNLPVNIGLAGAFQTGIRYAYENNYDAVLQFDGDGQHEAYYISELLAEMETKESEIVIGSRFVSEEKPFSIRMLGSRLLTAAIYLSTGKIVKDPTSGMRLYGSKVLELYAKNINYGPEPDTLAFLIRTGVRVSEVQVQMHERSAGNSYLTFGRSIQYMINMCISILFIQFFRNRG